MYRGEIRVSKSESVLNQRKKVMEVIKDVEETISDNYRLIGEIVVRLHYDPVPLKMHEIASIKSKADGLLGDDVKVFFNYISAREYRLLTVLMNKLHCTVDYNLKSINVFGEVPNDVVSLLYALSALGWRIYFYSSYFPVSSPVESPPRSQSEERNTIIVDRRSVIYIGGNTKFMLDADFEVLDPSFDSTVLFISHSHYDHVSMFLSREKEGQYPFIIANIPTVRLMYLKYNNQLFRRDLEKALSSYVFLRRGSFDDFAFRTLLSGHDYGQNIVLYDYVNGIGMAFFTDTNNSSFFVVSNGHDYSGVDADILFLEFPSFYRFSIPPIKKKSIVASIDGEYEELLTKLLDLDYSVAVDKNSLIAEFEKIRHDHKNFVKRWVRNVELDAMSVEEFLESKDHDILITHKSNLVEYTRKYRDAGIDFFHTNIAPKDTPNFVRQISVKTHNTLEEVMHIIENIGPKFVVFHNFKGQYSKVRLLNTRVRRKLNDINIIVSSNNPMVLKISTS